jgi:Transposase DDE domain group 1
MNLISRLSDCFLDGRDQRRVRHGVREMLSQRVYGLALGYEDLNDHEQLREDPILMLLAGSAEPDKPLAGKSTLNRLELGGELDSDDRYQKVHYDAASMDELLVKIFLEAPSEAPQEIVIDLDATDLPLHGPQEQRFFHGFYNHFYYSPLYIVCGEHLLGVRLRPANIDASAGSLEEMERLIGQIRTTWPDTRIILRADSGFCREALLGWCEANQVEYVFARNERLRRIIDAEMQQAAAMHQRTGQPARVFTEFTYETNNSRSRPRRVVAAAYILMSGLRRLALAGTGWRDRSAKPFACNCCVSALKCASALARSGFPWRAVIRIGARWKTLTCNSAPEIVSHPFFDNPAGRNAHSMAELALKAVAPGRARLQNPASILPLL